MADRPPVYGVGSVVKTRDGIVGEIVRIDGAFAWLRVKDISDPIKVGQWQIMESAEHHGESVNLEVGLCIEERVS